MKQVTFRELSVRRGAYIVGGFFLTLGALLPFDLSAEGLPRPDILYIITIIYLIRRPEIVPVWAVFLVFFLRDVLTTAPLGLWTFLVLVGTEVVRSNIQAFREYPFLLEWAWVVAIYGGALVAQQVVLTLTLAVTPGALDQLFQALFTAAAYPVIVAVLRFGFGIKRPPPGEYDAWGHRL